MARPRVFVSSTYYDLKHIRSSLELFIESLGYEPVLSEKGDIAYYPDQALDESCYREASLADIFVIVIGGRYGSEASSSSAMQGSTRERYDSITRREYETALKADVPIYILIENAVHAEYRTFLKNRTNKTISYAHVESPNVFELIDFILSQPRNNPVFDFERSAQIEDWLREQWAGLFREMLRARSQQKQLSALTDQITELREANETLKNYLEVVVKKVVPTKSDQVIATEVSRASRARTRAKLKENDLFSFLMDYFSLDYDKTVEAFASAENVSDLIEKLRQSSDKERGEPLSGIEDSPIVIKDANEARDILQVPPFPFPNQES